MADNLPEPKSRKESYLAKAAGMSVTIPEVPESRTEQYLAAIAEGGGGGGGTTYTAGANIQISDENVISATDTTYSNFVGTDGVDAGTAGLVPAPAVADADKFLKSDGTWSVAGGGSIGEARALTAADYNYPTNNPTSVGLWLLKPGIYTAKGCSVLAHSSAYANTDYTLVIVTQKATGDTVTIYGQSGYGDLKRWNVTATTGTINGSQQALLTGGSVYDNLTSTATTSPLSANQGRVLNNKFGGMQLVKISQTDYDNLGTKDPDTLYVITGA